MTSVGALVVGGDYRGLGIVRSLGRRGIMVWVAQGRDVLAGWSRYAQRRLHWPDGSEADQTEFLLRSAEEHGLDGWVLFPTGEDTAYVISRNSDALATRYRLTTSPWSDYCAAANKRLAYARAEALGIDVPRTWYPTSISDVERLDLAYPVIVKPALRVAQNLLTYVKAWPADNRHTLLARYAAACELLPSADVMIQEIIPGAGDTQLSFAAACRRGCAHAYLTARRARQYPVDFGRASTYVETIDRPDVVEPSLRLIADLHLDGLVEVEYKQDQRDGRLKLLDVNARAWGWHSIGTAAGIDFPYVTWRLAVGEPVTPVLGRPGVRWVRLAVDLPVSAREIVAGRLSAGSYLRSLRSPLEGPIAASDDPLPAVVDLPLLARRAVERRLGGERRQSPRFGRRRTGR
jgi:D-aspartate ligase